MINYSGQGMIFENPSGLAKITGPFYDKTLADQFAISAIGSGRFSYVEIKEEK